jgi:hypothetical protein
MFIERLVLMKKNVSIFDEWVFANEPEARSGMNFTTTPSITRSPFLMPVSGQGKPPAPRRTRHRTY